MSRKSRVLLFGALISFAGYLSLAVLATHQYFSAIDFGTRSWVALLKYEALDLPVMLVTELGDRAGLIPVLLLTIALLWRFNRIWAVALPVLMVGAWALQMVTKWAADRARPNEDPWGFPSGHVLSLVVFFGLMIWLIATAPRRRRRWRALACLACAATVAGVAFSRLYLDKHWLSDVAGGLAIGLAYLLFAIWLVEVAWTARPWLQRYSASAAAEPVPTTLPTTSAEAGHEDDRSASVSGRNRIGAGSGRTAADRESADEAPTR
jgi:undecaprenyl-diphosphatase